MENEQQLKKTVQKADAKKAETKNQHYVPQFYQRYILVGDFTIITAISFANDTLKTVRVWQMKLLLISCRRRWVI